MLPYVRPLPHAWMNIVTHHRRHLSSDQPIRQERDRSIEFEARAYVYVYGCMHDYVRMHGVPGLVRHDTRRQEHSKPGGMCMLRGALHGQAATRIGS